MPIDPRPRRRSRRLPGYDYSQVGAYFITACIHNRAMLFGAVIDGDVRPSEMGTIGQQTWDELPTHSHGIEQTRPGATDEDHPMAAWLLRACCSQRESVRSHSRLHPEQSCAVGG